MSEEKLQFKSGVTSTKQPRLSLIPHKGLVNAAVRFELGLQKHGEQAWNNLSSNQDALEDKEWLIERMSHAIEHAYCAIEKLKRGELALDDAGAIAWAGLVLGEAMSLQKGIYGEIEKREMAEILPKSQAGCFTTKSQDTLDKIGYTRE